MPFTIFRLVIIHIISFQSSSTMVNPPPPSGSTRETPNVAVGNRLTIHLQLLSLPLQQPAPPLAQPSLLLMEVSHPSSIFASDVLQLVKHSLTPITFILCISRKLHLLPTQTGPLASVTTMTMTSTVTTPSAVKEVAKNRHTTSLLWILLELYLLFCHEPFAGVGCTRSKIL